MAFFHNGLDVRGAEQLALYRVGLCHPELAVLGNVALPWKSLGCLKQLVKGLCLHLCNLQKNALCSSQENIGVCNSLGICQKSNLAILYLLIS